MTENIETDKFLESDACMGLRKVENIDLINIEYMETVREFSVPTTMGHAVKTILRNFNNLGGEFYRNRPAGESWLTDLFLHRWYSKVGRDWWSVYVGYYEFGDDGRVSLKGEKLIAVGEDGIHYIKDGICWRSLWEVVNFLLDIIYTKSVEELTEKQDMLDVVKANISNLQCNPREGGEQ